VSRVRLPCALGVTSQDAEDVVELLKQSLFDVCTDEFGLVDFSRNSGMSMGKQVRAPGGCCDTVARLRCCAAVTVFRLTCACSRCSQVKALVAALNREAERKGGSLFSMQVCISVGVGWMFVCLFVCVGAAVS
jgi:hypothetical protein